jgi:hypothetical protein
MQTDTQPVYFVRVATTDDAKFDGALDGIDGALSKMERTNVTSPIMLYG